MEKILIIRFSSLGDIVQCLFAVEALRERFPRAEIHWLVRSDFAELVHLHPGVDRVWSVDRKDGVGGLLRQIRAVKSEGFTHVYDAHCNVRSHVVSFLMGLPFRRFQFLRRSKDRLRRLLLFRLGINTFPKPYRAALSFLTPLAPWGVKPEPRPLPALKWPAASPLLKGHESLLRQSVALAPSAAWALKRWPLEHWKSLINIENSTNFVVLGGPTDEFCAELEREAPARVLNLAGRISWLETAQVIAWSRGLVSGDTGTLHIADLLGRPVLGLIGPTAFGFPTRATSQVLERDLACRPCSKDGRGRCKNSVFQRCLVEIAPRDVGAALNAWTASRN